MASVTSSLQSSRLSLHSGSATTIRIEPPGSRLILPISSVLSGLVDFAIGFVVLSIFCVVYGIRPTLAAFWLPVLLLLAFFTALGVGLWMFALNALYRDFRYVIPFIIQFWVFASLVAYATSLVPASWRWLYGLNPIAGVIDGLRWSITGRGHVPGLLLLASAFAVALVFLGGLFFFNRMIAWRPPLPIASSPKVFIRRWTTALRSIFRQANFSSLFDKCIGLAGWRPALDDVIQKRVFFYLLQHVEGIAAWFQKS